jgi:hypothetical protein
MNRNDLTLSLSPLACLRVAASAKAGERDRVRGDTSRCKEIYSFWIRLSEYSLGYVYFLPCAMLYALCGFM